MADNAKIAIVTGGISGIGAAVSRRFSEDGHIVIAADIAAESTTLHPGPGVHPYRVDVSDPVSVEALVNSVEETYGRIDHLVHSAGIGRVAPFLETPLEMFDLVLKINLYGTFIVGQACARTMAKAKSGVIVNIGSVSGLRGNAGRAAYGASKGGMKTLTEIMAVELASNGIRVNLIAPGPIETPLATTQHDKTVRDAWVARGADAPIRAARGCCKCSRVSMLRPSELCDRRCLRRRRRL